MDANLVFAREFQVYVLELNLLNDQFYNRMKEAYLFYLDGIENALSKDDYISGPHLTIADVSFVCDVAQFLRERDRQHLIKERLRDYFKEFRERISQIVQTFIDVIQYR